MVEWLHQGAEGNRYLCVAVFCSVLQCVAGCGSTWQYVAVHCSVLQLGSPCRTLAGYTRVP